MSPVQAYLASLVRQGMPGLGPKSAATPVLPLEGVSTSFETLLGDLMALLQGVGQTVVHAPEAEVSEEAVRRPKAPESADEGAEAAAPVEDPETDAPERSEESDPDPAVTAPIHAPAARPDSSGTSASATDPGRAATESADDLPVEAGRDASVFGRAPAAPPPAPVEAAPADAVVTPHPEVEAAPEEGSAAGEGPAPRPPAPRPPSVATLPAEAKVLFEGKETGEHPGAGPAPDARGPAPSSAGPTPVEVVPPAAPAAEAPPPAPTPASEAASAAVGRSVLEPTGVFATLQKALGFVVEEALPSEAGVSADAGGNAPSNPATIPLPAAAPVTPAAAAPGAPSGDPAAVKLEVGAAGRSGPADPAALKGPAVPRTAATDRTEVVERIVRAAKLARQQGEAHIKIVMRPPELGRVRVDLSVRNHVLTARLSADRPGAAELVQSNIGALRDALEQQGLRVGELRVSVDGDASGSSPRHASDGHGSSSGSSHDSSGDDYGPEEPEVPRRPAARAHALVDLFA